MSVDFEADGDKANAIYRALGSATPGTKNKTAAGRWQFSSADWEFINSIWGLPDR